MHSTALLARTLDHSTATLGGRPRPSPTPDRCRPASGPVRHMSRACRRRRRIPTRALSPQPPQTHQRRCTPLGIRFRRASTARCNRSRNITLLKSRNSPIPWTSPRRSRRDRLCDPCCRLRGRVRAARRDGRPAKPRDLLPGRLDPLGVIKLDEGAVPVVAGPRRRFPRIPPLLLVLQDVAIRRLGLGPQAVGASQIRARVAWCAPAGCGRYPGPRLGGGAGIRAAAVAPRVSLRRACKNRPPDAGLGGRPIGVRVANGSARGGYGSLAG